MGSRAAHNWKRRQKLLEKYGKGKGKGQSKADRKTGGKHAAGDKEGRRRARHSEAKVARPKRTRSSSSGTKVRAAAQGQPTNGRRKHLPVPAGSDSAKAGKTNVRAKAGLKKMRSSIHPKTEKVKKVKRLRKVRGKGITSKESRGRKVVKKRLLKLKQTARVVCPGSLTERFIACGRASAYSALTAFERRLLSTGQLSWRWLRDEDADVLPPSARRLEADPKAYHQAAISAEGSLPAPAVSRLWSVDAALETDALWPLCPERLQLALRLQCQKGLRRRSDRYVREVLTPLIDQSVLSAAWTDGSSRAALDQARRLLTGCTGAWMAATKQGADSALWKPAWSQMLRRSLNQMYKADEDLAREWCSWLSALRQVQLARLCPGLDLDAQLRLLRAVTLAVPSAKAAGDAAAPVVLPLGLFTFWQVLLLVALARRDGLNSMVVRRQAAGTPEVIFRTSSVDRKSVV